MHLRIKLAALAMAGGTAALVLTAVPALASSQAASKAVTGPETAYGVDLRQARDREQPHHPGDLAGAGERPRRLLHRRGAPRRRARTTRSPPRPGT